MKKLGGIVAILIAVALVALVVLTQTKEEQKEIRIGAILPLTGGAAQYGQWAKNAAQLAVEGINAKGGIGGKRLSVLFEDFKSDPKEGVNAFNKLIAVDNIQAAIMEYSGLVLATAPIAEQKKVVILNVGALNPQIRKAGDYTFSNINDASVEVYQLAEYAYDRLKIRRLALLYATASYGVASRDSMRERFVSLGGQIVLDESFEESSTDFRTQLLKIKTAKPEAIFLSAVTKDAALILKQGKELDLRGQWLSIAIFEGEDLLNVAGDAAEGAIYATTIIDLSAADPDTQEFISQYKRSYGVEPEIYAATAYDAINILAMAIQTVGYNGTKLKDFLYTVKDYPGVSGITTFDGDGAVNKPVVFKTVRNGIFVKVE